MNPDTGATRDLPPGLGWIELTLHQGYLYGLDGRTLTRLALDGTNVETVLDPAPVSFAFDAETLYYARRVNGGNDGDIVAAALDGSDARTLVAGQRDVGSVRIHAGALYWEGDGALMQWPLPSGAMRRIELPSRALAYGAFSGDALYWFDTERHELHELLLSSAQVTDFPDVKGDLLVSDGRALYFFLRRSEDLEVIRLRIAAGAVTERTSLATTTTAGRPRLDASFLYWAGCSGVVRVPK